MFVQCAVISSRIATVRNLAEGEHAVVDLQLDTCQKYRLICARGYIRDGVLQQDSCQRDQNGDVKRLGYGEHDRSWEISMLLAPCTEFAKKAGQWNRGFHLNMPGTARKKCEKRSVGVRSVPTSVGSSSRRRKVGHGSAVGWRSPRLSEP